MRDFEDIKQDVLARLDMRAVAEMCGLEVRRAGAGRWACCCPFHTERTASFTIGGRKGAEHRGHCFGCGWDGDIFAFWKELKGSDFKQTLLDLAAVCGVPIGDGVMWAKPDVPKVRQPEKRLGSERPEHEMPSLPPLRHLREGECQQLAQVRGLNPEAVWIAARTFKRIAYSDWPLYHGWDGDKKAWLPRSAGCWPSWCITDETRAVAEFRRLDNGMYPRQDGSEIKSWSTCGKAWPVGAASMNGRPAVMLVEGGPDLLAAYHFLLRWRMLDRVAVVAMLGASNRIREDALPFFKGKRVRIMVDADPLKDDVNPSKRKLPGMEAARRWSEQLCAAGAAVQCFNVGPIYDGRSLRDWMTTPGPMWSGAVDVKLDGLRLPDGKLVKDLNDLAKCDAEVADSPEVRRAFKHWDF